MARRKIVVSFTVEEKILSIPQSIQFGWQKSKRFYFLLILPVIIRHYSLKKSKNRACEIIPERIPQTIISVKEPKPLSSCKSWLSIWKIL